MRRGVAFMKHSNVRAAAVLKSDVVVNLSTDMQAQRKYRLTTKLKAFRCREKKSENLE